MKNKIAAELLKMAKELVSVDEDPTNQEYNANVRDGLRLDAAVVLVEKSFALLEAMKKAGVLNKHEFMVETSALQDAAKEMKKFFRIWKKEDRRLLNK